MGRRADRGVAEDPRRRGQPHHEGRGSVDRLDRIQDRKAFQRQRSGGFKRIGIRCLHRAIGLVVPDQHRVGLRRLRRGGLGCQKMRQQARILRARTAEGQRLQVPHTGERAHVGDQRGLQVQRAQVVHARECVNIADPGAAKIERLHLQHMHQRPDVRDRRAVEAEKMQFRQAFQRRQIGYPGAAQIERCKLRQALKRCEVVDPGDGGTQIPQRGKPGEGTQIADIGTLQVQGSQFVQTGKRPNAVDAQEPQIEYPQVRQLAQGGQIPHLCAAEIQRDNIRQHRQRRDIAHQGVSQNDRPDAIRRKVWRRVLQRRIIRCCVEQGGDEAVPGRDRYTEDRCLVIAAQPGGAAEQ